MELNTFNRCYTDAIANPERTDLRLAVLNASDDLLRKGIFYHLGVAKTQKPTTFAYVGGKWQARK
jgi:hypothetical protein